MAAEAELNLNHVPPEVVEKIIKYLDLNTIKSLRLTSKVFGERCLGPRFKSFLKQQTTDLTEQSLWSLCTLASHPELGPAVKNLTIMATVYDASKLERILSTKKRRIVESSGPFARKEEREALSNESVIDSLASALRLLGRLDSVDLDATVVQGPNVTVSTATGEWHPIWILASQVYCLTMSAVARSGVAVDTVTVYRNTPRCSVPSCDITAHVEKLDAGHLTFAGTSIKNLALSISTKVETDFHKITAARERLEGADRAFHEVFGSKAGLLEASNPEALAEENFLGIARLLRLMPKLEAIDLHLYDTLEGDAKAYDQIFKAIAREVHLPSLEQCFLRGIYASEESMLQFLENHPRINHLDLREMTITSGSWEPIFKYLGSRMTALTRLRLSNLRDENKSLRNLNPVWEEGSGAADYSSSYPCGGGLMVHTREFDVDDFKKGLSSNHVRLVVRWGRPSSVAG
ncbi:hypothetical protein VTN00DRAFT_1413 [Thermoascus crustaceus]|uniref:uncharacterized protein n=1 Tax=Thermoascus crustaceus TaxID=5088 RepID=UPI0037427063